jgi:hypothetical protein
MGFGLALRTLHQLRSSDEPSTIRQTTADTPRRRFRPKTIFAVEPYIRDQEQSGERRIVAAGAPVPELASPIGNYAYLKFIKLCESSCEPDKAYIAADELAEIFGLDADQLRELLDLALFTPEQVRELIDQGAIDRGFVETFVKNRPPMNIVMPMLKEIASHYVKGIRLDKLNS